MLLNDLIPQKATQTREEASSFESSLASQFRSLSSKSGENVNKVNEQVDLLIEQAEKENDIANRVAKLSAMFSKNALLESLVYSKINSKLDEFPKKTEEDLKIEQSKQQQKPPQQGKPSTVKQKKKSKPKKLASGGIKPPIGYDSSMKGSAVDAAYANSLVVSLQASGIAAVTTLGEFIKGTGALGAFFAPYLNSVVKPFASALGVGDTIVNSLLGSPVRAATLDLQKQQKHFGKTWAKYLNDPIFVAKYIDREGDPSDPNRPPGYVPAKWDEDPEFVALVNAFAQEWGLNANGLLALMASESGIDPSKFNSSGCVGLIQFCPGGGLGGTGKTAQELSRMTRSEQWPYVVNYWVKSGLEKGMTAGDIYGLTHVPNWYKRAVEGKAIGSVERMNAVVATSADGGAYSDNARLDFNNDGKITVQDYDDEVKRVGKSFGIEYEKGGYQKLGGAAPITPYLMSGPDAGYKALIQGTPVTLHGDEVVAENQDGFQVYPVRNRRYNIFKNPDEVGKRWSQIARGANTQHVLSFMTGGSAEFWKIAALASKEDSLNPQGQADVAQSLYNRAAIGSYPGGKSISAIITSPGQYQPTFNNAGKWNAIKDRQSAAAATGNAQKVDMAARSITNPNLQREAQKFVGGRTDFMGESQKPYMKPGDITRGKGYNFHGWFYDARLPKAAAVPKMVSTQTRVTASTTKPAPKVIVNKVSAPAQPNIIQQAQTAVVTFTNMIFNPHKVKTELNMKRAR
jgi:hypothetical protein